MVMVASAIPPVAPVVVVTMVMMVMSPSPVVPGPPGLVRVSLGQGRAQVIELLDIVGVAASSTKAAEEGQNSRLPSEKTIQ